MFNQLYENIVLRDRIEKKLLSLLEGKTWEQIALELYQILDDIDTADDVCKVNAELFQEMVMKLQAKKNQLLYSPDGQIVKRVDERISEDFEALASKAKGFKKADTFAKRIQLSKEEVQALKQAGFTKREERGALPDLRRFWEEVNEFKLKEHLNDDGSGDTEDIDDVRPTSKNKKSGPPKKKKLTPEEWKKQYSDPIRYGGKELTLKEEQSDIDRQVDLGISSLSKYNDDVTKVMDYLMSLPEKDPLNPEEWVEVEQYIQKHVDSLEESKLKESMQNTAHAIVVRMYRDHGKNLDYDDVLKYINQLRSKDYRDLEMSIKEVDSDMLARIMSGVRIKESKQKKGKILFDSMLKHNGIPLRAFKLKENLTDYARNELQIAGLFDKDSDYDGMLGEATIELINVFAKQDHSGFSASLVRELFSKLSNFKPLTEISNNPEEWMNVDGKDTWQSRRNPILFSNDEGKTYYDLDEIDENGNKVMHTSKDYEQKKT